MLPIIEKSFSNPHIQEHLRLALSSMDPTGPTTLAASQVHLISHLTHIHSATSLLYHGIFHSTTHSKTCIIFTYMFSVPFFFLFSYLVKRELLSLHTLFYQLTPLPLIFFSTTICCLREEGEGYLRDPGPGEGEPTPELVSSTRSSSSSRLCSAHSLTSEPNSTPR